MAGIIFDNLAFNYKQFDTAPDPINVDLSEIAEQKISFGNVPSFVDIRVLTETANTFIIKVSVKEAVASDFLGGTYKNSIDVFSETNINGSPSYFKEGTINIDLTIIETVLLAVSQENVLFSYQSGGAVPNGKIIQITSENNWTVSTSNPWLSTSVASGYGNGSFTISVDPTNLTDSTNLATVNVYDGFTTVIINVTLSISDGNTSEEYLYLSPSELDFIKNKNSSFNPTKTLYLNSSGNWIATTSASWLKLSNTSGSAGTDNIIVSIDVTLLNVGVYSSEIIINSNNRVKKTYVSLSLTKSEFSIPDSGNLYFSQDDVSILLNSENENAVLEVDFNLEATDVSKLYQKRAPYYNSKATVNVGEECVEFIKPLDFDVPIVSKITSIINTAIINFTAYEKNYFNSNVIVDFTRNNLNFLNGKTPEIENKLNYVPSLITVSRKGVIALHIYKKIDPGNIYISGSITKTITFNDAVNSNIYSAFINLADFNLNPLDVITINFDEIATTLRIREDEAESVLLVFENEWQLPEIIELTGGLEVKDDAFYATQKIQVGKNIVEQIYNTQPSESFSIFTGFIESDAEIKWLSKIRNSEKIYLIINEEKIEVIPTFKSLPVYKTREHQKNFRLTFKKAIV